MNDQTPAKRGCTMHVSHMTHIQKLTAALFVAAVASCDAANVPQEPGDAELLALLHSQIGQFVMWLGAMS